MNNQYTNDSCNSEDPSLKDTPTMILPVKECENELEAKHKMSQWSALHVVEWMERLALSTEKMDGKGPVRLGNANLAPSTRKPVPSIGTLTQATTVTTTQPLLGGDTSLSPTGQCQWHNLSLIERQDPLAWIYTRNIRSLAGHLEELLLMGEKTSESEEYSMVQTRLEYTFQQLLSQHMLTTTTPSSECLTTRQDFQSGGKLRPLLDALYDETIMKLRSIITNQRKAQLGEDEDVSASKNTNPSPPPKEPMQKQELATFMTDWLIGNWINPYPDDDGLKEIAAHCGHTKTPQVISNWLINARTRKWRPALQQACNMDRPSEMLLEDSPNILTGHPLRRLPMVAATRPTPPHKAYFAEKGRFPKDGDDNDAFLDLVFVECTRSVSFVRCILPAARCVGTGRCMF